MSCLDAVNRLAVTNFGMRVVPGWSGLALGRYRKKKEEGRECTTHPFPPPYPGYCREAVATRGRGHSGTAGLDYFVDLVARAVAMRWHRHFSG